MPLTTRAFSLAELLVVVSIIALLISIALPAFRGARRQAKEMATRAEITAAETGISQYQAEAALGGGVPPSVSDRFNNLNFNTNLIVDPYDTVSSPNDVPASGATLLCLALAGPDKNGTAGFSSSSGIYWGLQTGGFNSGGLYDTNTSVPAPRYGAFANDTLLEKMTPLGEVKDLGVNLGSGDTALKRQRVFLDVFGKPILYYRGRKAARRMMTDGTTVGVYDSRHNGWLIRAADPLANDTRKDPDPSSGNLYNPPEGSFGRFILDETASTLQGGDPTKILKAVPYRKDFMLISAGDDGIYGTKDDITNWNK